MELNGWIDGLSYVDEELSCLKLIEQRFIKNKPYEIRLTQLRRKNTLLLGGLCKYEKELKSEYEYGKRKYDLARAKVHELKRLGLETFFEEFRGVKKEIYLTLSGHFHQKIS